VLRGTKSNRDGVGARVEVHVNGRLLVRELRSGGSYLSSHDMRLLFGLGDAQMVERIVVQWPGAKEQVVEGAQGNQYLTIEENASK
jgi:enediyne biosynthesis protein E4